MCIKGRATPWGKWNSLTTPCKGKSNYTKIYVFTFALSGRFIYTSNT